MAVVFANNAKTTLASSVSTSATSISVVDGSVFPAISGSDYTYVTFEDTSSNVEVVKVTARSGNTLTVVRGQDGTSATAYSAGDKCELRITAALLNDLNTEADTESVSRDGDTMTGNLSFGDNNKALFGAGSDLQIYHDGSASYIDDSGEGDLVILSSARVRFEGKSTGDTYMRLNENSSVQIYHDNTARLTTTSTGIDVTGIVDASDLVRFGVNNSEIANNYVRFKPSGAAYIDHSTVGQAINFRVSGSSSLDTNALTISSTGIEVSGTVTADGDGLIQKSTGAKLQIKSTTNFISPNDVVGSLDFVSADYNYTAQPIKGQISSVATNPSGTGESALFISTTETTNLRNRIKIDYNGDISFYDTDGTTASFVYDADAGLTINEGGADRDFRVESDNNAHMLYVNASNDRVSIGTNTRSAVLTIQSAGNGYSTGSIALKGAGISDTNYLTNAGGNFYISHNGTYDDFVLKSGDLILNESGMDRDFRVESDSDTHALFVNGENGRTGLGVANPQASLDVKSRFLANHNDGHAEVTIASTSNRQPSLTFKEGTSTRATLFTAAGSNDLTLDAAGDIILDADGGDIIFRDGGSSKLTISNTSDDVTFTNGVQDKDLIFKGYDGTSLITALTLGMANAGAATFNSTVSVAGVGVIGTTDGDLNIYSTAANHGGLRFGNTYVGPTNNAGTITTDAISLGLSGQRFTNLYLSDSVQNSGKAGSASVFNEDGTTADFRVESDGQSHMFFIDGGANKIAIGHSVPDTELHVIANGNDAQMPFIVGNENITADSTSQSVAMGFGLARDSGTVKNNAGLIQVGKTAAWTSDDAQIDSYMGLSIYKNNAVTEHLKIEPTQIRIGNTSDHVMVDIAASNAAIKLIDNNQSNPPTLRGNGPNLTIENQGFNRIAAYSGSTVINDDGQDQDFRVESDANANMLWVDASRNGVGVGTSSVFEHQQGAAIDMSYDGTIWSGNTYWAGGLKTGTTFYVQSSGDRYKHSSRQATQHYQNSQGGSHHFYSAAGGTAGDVITWRELAEFDRDEVVFNNQSADQDFRVESNDNSHQLAVDALRNNVQINNSNTVTNSDNGSVIVGKGAVYYNQVLSVPSPYSGNIQIDLDFSNWGSNNTIAAVEMMILTRQFGNTSGIAMGKMFATNSGSGSQFVTFTTTDITTSNCTFTASSPNSYRLRLVVNPSSNTDLVSIVLTIPTLSTSGLSEITAQIV